jgi:hypothetical protein
MTKKSLLLGILIITSLATKAQVVKYQIGKYRATVDFYKMRMKWELGKTFSQIVELPRTEKNVTKYQESENGKISGVFELYYITDGETVGRYVRIDGKEFDIQILKTIKK